MDAVRVIAVASLLLTASCSSPVSQLPPYEPEPEAPEEWAYQNPVLDRDFPDPTVIAGHDGRYYAYATETMINGTPLNIQVASSDDLVSWRHEGDALPSGAAWAAQSRTYWAPHVTYAPEQGRYIMYYSAHHDARNRKCLAVATSDSPTGPFQDSGQPLLCGHDFVEIDPMAFDDPVSGKKLLYWGSGFQPIKVQELADDRMSFKEGSQPTPIVAPGEDAVYSNLVEGAWVVHRDDYYYLFYSGDNCCGASAHYAVMVSRATDPMGPFTSLGEATGTGRSAILQQNSTWNAPGHNSVIRDEDGVDWMFYHAIDREQPTRYIGIGDAQWDRRVMMLDRIVYEGGWPKIEGGRPAEGSDVAPAVD